MKTIAVITAVAIAVTGCAGANYRPMVDIKGIDMNRYEADLRECQQYAMQVGGAAQNAVAGAMVGAIFGAILASAAGRNYDRGATSRVGAVTGAASGAAAGEHDQQSVIRNCLSGRGYRVLR